MDSGPDEMVSRAAFGPRAVVWRPWIKVKWQHSVDQSSKTTKVQST